MCPRVLNLIRLDEAAGRKWETISEVAYEQIRIEEDRPDTTTIVIIQMDEVMLPLATNIVETQGSGAVIWIEVACRSITLLTADGTILRTIRHGRMPDSGKGMLKPLLAADIDHFFSGFPIVVL